VLGYVGRGPTYARRGPARVDWALVGLQVQYLDPPRIFGSPMGRLVGPSPHYHPYI